MHPFENTAMWIDFLTLVDIMDLMIFPTPCIDFRFHHGSSICDVLT